MTTQITPTSTTETPTYAGTARSILSADRFARSAGKREPSVREKAARSLVEHGGDPTSGSKTGAAVERFFSTLQHRYSPLVGPGGYRSLLEQAHAAALRDHPVLEYWPVRRSGNPFFGNLETRAACARAQAKEVWDGLVALTAEFLSLSETLGRRGEAANGNRTAGNAKSPRRWSIGGSRGTGATLAPPPTDTAEIDAHVPQGGDGGHGRNHQPWRILVLDRDLATCQAMAQALNQARDFDVVGYAMNVEEIEREVTAEHVDFVVASGHLPSDEVLELCRWFRQEHAGEPPYLIVTGLPEDEALILEVLEAGAAAFTMGEFSVEGLRLTLRLLARGEAVFPLRLQHLMALRLSELAELVRDRGLNPETISSLTPREKDVLELLEEDLTNRQIARRLYISEGTVKSHVHQILHKLKVRDRNEAVRVARLRRAGAS